MRPYIIAIALVPIFAKADGFFGISMTQEACASFEETISRIAPENRQMLQGVCSETPDPDGCLRGLFDAPPECGTDAFFNEDQENQAGVDECIKLMDSSKTNQPISICIKEIQDRMVELLEECMEHKNFDTYKTCLLRALGEER